MNGLVAQTRGNELFQAMNARKEETMKRLDLQLLIYIGVAVAVWEFFLRERVRGV
jgi:hypothetical protein